MAASLSSMTKDFNPLEVEFTPWPKIARFNRDIVVTEKIDGTNAAIGVLDDGTVYAQSRKHVITSEKDNAGFARFVEENADTFRECLGPGLHFGEWWGQGINRRYGLDRKVFSLFNTARWGDLPSTVDAEVLAGTLPTDRLAFIGVRSVPVLYSGPMAQGEIVLALNHLKLHGSVAAPGWKAPEGVVVFHTAANMMFKATIVDDEKPKGSQE